MESELIGFIQTRMTTPRWRNGKAGMFEYIQERCVYRFIETSQNLNYYLIAERLRNDENTPIAIKGFIAFLIACWGQDEVAIYNTYNERKKKAFVDIEAKKPGTFKRNLDQEFGKQLLETEQINIEEFEKSFDYISPEEKLLILEYAQNYLEYVSSVYKQKIGKTKRQETFKNLLIHDRIEDLMKLLHELLDYKKGKDVVAVIKAMEKLLLLKPYSSVSHLHTLLTQQFGDIGGVRNFSNYMNGTNECHVQKPSIEEAIVILGAV